VTPPRWPDAPPSVVHMLARAVRDAPGAEALVCGDARLSYADYGKAVAALAKRLGAAGVAKGDRVAVILPNGIGIAVASMAVMAAGAVLVPLNPLYTAHELGYILRDAAPVAVIAEPGLEAAREAAEGLDPVWIAPEVDTDGGALPGLPDPGALAMIQYTGGTTGKPKGVMLGHDGLAANVAQREARLPTRWQADRVLIVTPLYHSYATAMGLFLAMNGANALHILPRYDGPAVLETIAGEAITLFAGSPAIYIDLLGQPGLAKANLGSLRLCFSGSAALPAQVLDRWQTRAGCPVVEGYGQTEAGPVLTYMGMDGPRLPGTVGTALGGTEMRIVDVGDTGRDMPVGEPGEIVARGPQIMRGYWNLPEVTAETLAGGWLRTGDIGSLDAGGVLTVRDRKKDMVIVSGFNVYPREIEEELHAHPAVREAAVIGRPDPRKGEALVAFVVPSGAVSEADLRGWLSERLTRYKQPSEIVMTDTLPKSAIGKIDKTALRARGDAA
jgi:long-chain acyl-CoA synthetase